MERNTTAPDLASVRKRERFIENMAAQGNGVPSVHPQWVQSTMRAHFHAIALRVLYAPPSVWFAVRQAKLPRSRHWPAQPRAPQPFERCNPDVPAI